AASPARSAGVPAPPCRPFSAASLSSCPPRPSVFQALGRPVLVEALGRPLAGVLGVERPVRLLVEMALVEHGFVAFERDQLGDEGGLSRRGRAADVGLQLVAEPGDDALQDYLVLQAEIAAGALADGVEQAPYFVQVALGAFRLADAAEETGEREPVAFARRALAAGLHGQEARHPRRHRGQVVG